MRSLAKIRQGKLPSERTSSRNHKFGATPGGLRDRHRTSGRVYILADDGESNLARRLQG
jgi:hypothetical protein